MDERLKNLKDEIIRNGTEVGATNIVVSFDDPDPDILFSVSFDLEEN